MSVISRLCVAGLIMLGLGACATTPVADEIKAPVPIGIFTPEGETGGDVLGDYLVARFAANLGDSETQSQNYARVFAREPENADIGRRALVSSLMDGNMALSEKLAADVLTLDSSSSMSRAILGAFALEDRRYKISLDLLDPEGVDVASGAMMRLMSGWAAEGKGDTAAAMKEFKGIQAGRYFSDIADIQIAKLHIRNKDYAAAETILEGLSDSINAREAMAMAYLEVMVKQGRLDDANAYAQSWSRMSQNSLWGPVNEIAADSKKLKALGRKKHDPAISASEALTEPAIQFARQGSHEAGNLYLQLARILDKDNKKAKLWLAYVQENLDQTYRAQELYRSVDTASPYYVAAQIGLANLYISEEEDAEAVAGLERLARDYPVPIVKETLARAYLIKEDYAAALPLYEDVLASAAGAKRTDAMYYKAVILENLGRWNEAETLLMDVLDINPDDVNALNYLGYSWIDRRENLEEAFILINRAVELQPRSGAIIDSLGWAHYRLGDYDQAMDFLELAAEMDPSNWAIVDHLGDTYWRLGRTREAGYQWQRALQFEPDEEDAAKIREKLKNGLPEPDQP